ncbi:MAG: hypothetical protein WCI04_03890 [archaeon]
MTLSIPKELKEEMDQMKFINWSEVARKAIKEKVVMFKIFDTIAKKSKLTEKDALEISKKINKGMTEKLLKRAGLN